MLFPEGSGPISMAEYQAAARLSGGASGGCGARCTTARWPALAGPLRSGCGSDAGHPFCGLFTEQKVPTVGSRTAAWAGKALQKQQITGRPLATRSSALQILPSLTLCLLLSSVFKPTFCASDKDHYCQVGQHQITCRRGTACVVTLGQSIKHHLQGQGLPV